MAGMELAQDFADTGYVPSDYQSLSVRIDVDVKYSRHPGDYIPVK